MRKSNYEMAHALMELRPYRRNNRRVVVAKSDKELLEVPGCDWPAIEGKKLHAVGYLFDKPIVAVMRYGLVCMTHAGYNTLTTRTTLTEIVQEMRLRYWFGTIRGTLYCSDIPISSTATMFFSSNEKKLLCIYDYGKFTEGM